MYTDEQLDELADMMNKGYYSLYEKYLKKIGERINKIGDLRPTELHQLNRLKDIYADVAQLKRDLARLTGKTVADIDAVLMNAAQMNYTGAKELYGYRDIPFVPMAKNTALFNLAKAITAQTAGRFYNLSNTTGNLFEGEYKALVDEAVKAVSSGVSSYSTEIYNILKDTPPGLKVLYDSGYKRRFDSALRMNIIDGVREINQQIQDEIGEELGCDGVELSAHALCAPDHLPYQGRQYNKEAFANIQAGLHRRFGIWNCKHFWHSIILGVSKPINSEETLESYKKNSEEKINIDGKEVTRYEASQIGRKLETEIRKAKEMQILGKSTGNERLISDSQRRIMQLTAKYREVFNKAGLNSQLADRARVQGYKKVQTQAEKWTVQVKDIVTSNGVKVTEVSQHFYDQAKSRNILDLITRENITQTLKNPLKTGIIKVDNKGRSSQQFVGEKLSMAINNDTGVLSTVWKTSGKKKGGTT